MTNHFYMNDVFAERPYSGNPLAVVVSSQTLSDKTMQQLAAEMNFSETTFVKPVPEKNGGYRVRIFTPAREIAFAGHPILGTAQIIRQHVINERCSQVLLNLAMNQISVTFDNSADHKDIAWFLAPPISLEATVESAPIAAALGLSPEDIETKTPIQVMSAGTSALIVPLRNLDALKRSMLNLEVFATLADDGFPPLIYLFCQQTHDTQNDLCARFFFEANGVREDPATGNGAAFLGAYLLEHNYFNESNLSIRIEQGYEIHRPSLVLLRTQEVDEARKIFVGGSVIQIVEGKLL